ncbi:MAG TPA: porin family protein [Bradyrhizobium sp.]|nr:porin family protein [Bradyrhizobium sp.]
MKKLVLAVAAAAAFSGSAVAADLAARPYTKAPPPVAPAVSWTGCYLGAGGGGGFYVQEEQNVTVATGLPNNVRLDQGGRGWLATVQGGCDYQFPGLGSGIVIGAFADGDWTNIRGQHTGQNGAVGLIAAESKIDWSWAVGGRAGILITPNLLTYFSAGYTEAHVNGLQYVNFAGAFTGLGLNSQRYQGWFIGAGDEYALGFLPGLFWKTEYRFADYGTNDVPVITTATGLPTATSERTHLYTHTVRSELVYRFNWGGPVVAKY